MFNLDHKSSQFGAFVPAAAPKMPWGCFNTAGERVARAPSKKKASDYAKRFGYKVSKIN